MMTFQEQFVQQVYCFVSARKMLIMILLRSILTRNVSFPGGDDSHEAVKGGSRREGGGISCIWSPILLIMHTTQLLISIYLFNVVRFDTANSHAINRDVEAEVLEASFSGSAHIYINSSAYTENEGDSRCVTQHS